MKFHKLEIENITSLYGKHVIDFDGVFGDAGLYLITGPTGGGKTTLLDAICLTLFAKTARLGGAPKAVADSLMSRGTGTAVARLHFSLLGSNGERHRYEAAWSVNRARERADGNMQDVRREFVAVAADGTRTVLCNTTKAKDASAAFTQIFGDLSLDVFLRSVMLPQGDFARLLKADEKTKASILNRVANTERYLRIGAAAEERKKLEQQACETLEARLEGFSGATPESIAEAQADLTEAIEVRDGLAAYDSAAAEWMAWLTADSRISTEAKTAEEEAASARAEQEAHAAEFALRDADRSVQPARKPLEDMDRERQLAKETADTLDATKARLQVVEAERAVAAEGLQNAANTLTSANAELDAKADELKRAREAKGSADAALKAAAKAETQRNTRQKAVTAADADVKQKATAVATSQAIASQANTALAEVSEDASLRDVLVQCEALAKQVRQRDSAATERQRDEHVATVEIRRLQTEQAELAAATSAVEEAHAAVLAAEAELTPLLGAFPSLSSWRDADDERTSQREQRKRQLLAAQAALADLIACATAQRAQAANKKQAEQTLAEAHAKQSGAQEALESAEQALQSARDEAARADRVALAATLRSALCADEACPVCGSEDHPAITTYGDAAHEPHDPAQDPDETAHDAALARAEAAIDHARSAVNEAQTDVALANRAVQAGTETLAETERRRDEAATRLQTAIQPFDDELTPEEREAEAVGHWLDAELSALEEQAHEDATQTQRVKAAAKALEAAQLSAKQAVEANAERTKRLDAIKNAISVASAKSASAAEQREREHAQALALEAEFEALLTAANIAPPRHAERLDAGLALDSLRERVRVFEARTRAAAEASAAAEAARNEHDAAERKHKEAIRELGEANQHLEDAKKEADAHKTTLAALLGGEDPDEVETRHKATIAAASAARDAAQKAATEAESAVVREQTRVNELTKRVEHHTAQAIAADGILRTALATIDGAETVDDIRNKLLSDDERVRITELCSALERRLEAAQTDVARLATQAAAHVDARPEGLDAEVATLEGVGAARAQITEALETWMERVGSCRERVKQLLTDARKAAELLAEADAQRAIAGTWQRLHDLIGVRSGESFQRFALALALERLLLRANHRLQSLHPRYQLAPTPDETGLPTLDFDVIDQYQAGATRPVATLSGGESFLASLALALAVVDEQQLSLPIETLLLDEGFGTLDERSLSQAMTTLERLQLQDSRTVGLISHVESLKTRITNQVLLLPAGQDRSTVKLRVWSTPN